jgi:chorismate dehydratase
VPLRVAAISFLNPAPLLYSFEHEPTATELRTRYTLTYTSPAHCAEQLHAGVADLGLIPIAELDLRLAIVPGCTIASLHEVRSILLLVKNPLALPVDEALKAVRTIAADAASRSSLAYARIIFEHFHRTSPSFKEHPADPLIMLATADAALLIGDPALLAREHQASINAAHHNQLLWLDLAKLWRTHTGLPWVAAVWAVCPEALTDNGGPSNVTAQQLIADTNNSRLAGLANIDTLVREWTPRLGLPPTTIRTYLTQNIHYELTNDCLRAITLFRQLAAGIKALPPLPTLNILSA